MTRSAAGSPRRPLKSRKALKTAGLWILTVVITLASAVYQRMTGPTQPVRGEAVIGNDRIGYRLPRSADNDRDCEISLRVSVPGLGGRVSYKRFKTDDPWTDVPLEQKPGALAAFLPRQPAAGKLAYRVFLSAGGGETALGGEEPVVIRFKGPVPAAVLIPHVLVMFLAMLLATRAGIAAVVKGDRPRKFALATAALMFAGGLILGPIVQHYAFGVWWSGIPFGTDLTDNKTLIAMIAWAAALVAGRRGRPARAWVLAASLITLVVFLIPHSLMGSEYKYR